VQLAPLVPQVAVDAALQTPLAQQPPGHEVLLQTQLPPTQRVPAPHAAPEPHIHAPSLLHLSARVALQAAQLAPGAPHVLSPSVVQLLPLQQPLAQDRASHRHAPPTQC